jgi:acyl-coenzyme A thioesterase PaaI-like protein
MAAIDFDGHREAGIVPELCLPGTAVLRASVLATWADTVSGLAAAGAIAPQVPTTLGLDLQLYRRPERLGRVRASTSVLKAGRSVLVIEVALEGDDDPLGYASVSFMAAPAPAFELPGTEELAAATRARRGHLSVPFAERARCERRGPGVVAIPLHDDGVNATMTMNGGLLALAAEEAACSAMPGATLASLGLHYLRPVRIGPAVATATVHGQLARVEVRDAGAGDRLAVVAAARAFPPG